MFVFACVCVCVRGVSAVPPSLLSLFCCSLRLNLNQARATDSQQTNVPLFPLTQQDGVEVKKKERGLETFYISNDKMWNQSKNWNTLHLLFLCAGGPQGVNQTIRVHVVEHGEDIEGNWALGSFFFPTNLIHFLLRKSMERAKKEMS